MAKKPATKADGPVKSGEVALGPGCRMAIFHGDEAFLRTGYTDQLKKVVEQAGHEVQVVKFDGETATPADVLDECRSMGLLAGYKIVVVDRADEFLKEPGESEEAEEKAEAPGASRGRSSTRRAMLERYAQSPSDGVTLVLRAEGWRPKTNLEKYVEKIGLVIECALLDARRAAAWAVTRAHRTYTRTLEPDAAELLVESLSRSLSRIDGELLKLAGATKPEEPINAELVTRLVTVVAEERKPWVLADQLLNPDPAPGLTLLHELVDSDGIDPVPLRWACMDLAAKIHILAHEIAGGTAPSAAGRSFKFFFGPKAEAARRAAQAAGPARAAGLLAEAVEADFRGKTGQGDPVMGLERLVMEFSRLASLSAGRGSVR